MRMLISIRLLQRICVAFLDMQRQGATCPDSTLMDDLDAGLARTDRVRVLRRGPGVRRGLIPRKPTPALEARLLGQYPLVAKLHASVRSGMLNRRNGKENLAKRQV